MKRCVLPLFGLLLIFVLPGCVGPFKGAAIEPGNDPVVVHAERAQRISLDTFARVTKWEYTNRFSLPAEVSRAVDAYRTNFPSMWRESRVALSLYKQNAGPDPTRIESITAALWATHASLLKLKVDQNPSHIGEAMQALQDLIKNINLIFTPIGGNSTNATPVAAPPRTNTLGGALRTVSP